MLQRKTAVTGFWRPKIKLKDNDEEEKRVFPEKKGNKDNNTKRTSATHYLTTECDGMMWSVADDAACLSVNDISRLSGHQKVGSIPSASAR
jgi:hypothetical protein